MLKVAIEEVDNLTCGYIGMTDYMNSLEEEYGIDIKKIFDEIKKDKK